ncbi:DUF2612 domain-containing protein [Pseudomonas sp. dw_358]|uniref:DUF2612 domain-containing protein n=1 Tax=Pseudomonas sp. dw_358 TaxID=2720083 RepID=UPI001BD45889|nr:DUF2612 domain-containing protein [Pseudomonas sp. dw_358]
MPDANFDYVSKAESRIYGWFQKGPKLVSWIDTIPALVAANLENPLQILNYILDYQNISGAMLDIVGRIVGITERPRISMSALEYFGYLGDLTAKGYNQAPYYDAEAAAQTIPIPDYTFKSVIKAKIYKNSVLCTIDAVKEAIDDIFGISCTVIDNKDMTMSINLNTTTYSSVLYYLAVNYDLIPKPPGVQISSINGGS